jgi:sulfonate transport system ATP-binding protein
LLRLIAGLDRASAGTIRLDGEPISEPHRAVGLVFQEPRLLPWLSVADNVGFGLDGLPKAERRERIAHALDKVGLADHAAAGRAICRAANSSGCHRPRFRRQPKVLLLDEPFSALDAFTRAACTSISWPVGGDRPDGGSRHPRRAGGVTLADRVHRHAAQARPHLRRIAAHSLSRPRDRTGAALRRPPCAAS